VFPSRYEDLPEIIINFNIQTIKELVEREKYFEHFESQLKAKNERGQFERDLKKYYHYVTVTREEMMKEVSDLLNGDHELRFKKRRDLWTKKIKKIEKLDEEMIIWVAKYRQYFWT
jgi:ATP-dependent RNA circularization protein (DNA/RNA ligase family)